MNKFYRKLRAQIRRRKWRPKLLSPLPPFGKKFIRLTKFVSTKRRARKLAKKGKSPNRLPSIRKMAPRFTRVSEFATPLHTTGDDLWIRFSESDICSLMGSCNATILQDQPTVYPKLKTHALSNCRNPRPQDAPPQSPNSCDKKPNLEIPKVSLFDRFFEQPQSLQKKPHNPWQIYRASDTSEILPHEPDIRRRCRTSHHWGRNIIESERLCQDLTTCPIM